MFIDNVKIGPNERSAAGGDEELYVSLYRRYRPQRFSEVVGQAAATDLLRLSFLEKRLGHAYLFSGPRGCGKTTAARLVAKVVNCERPTSEGEPCCDCDSCRAVVSGEHLDVMEIDGASNRGIDQIRELKSHVGLAPFMGGNKVYILDEVHMLTTEAFNALLKTLEEPPPSVLFLFATTEPHKVPVTIRSRCQHIPFHRISAEDIVEQLRFVASEEGFEAEAPALWEIARSADGALRDALSLAEQALALGNGALTMDAVMGLFGGGSRGELERWVTLLRTDPAQASALLKNLLDRGVSPERFLDALFPLLRDMWVYGQWGERSFDGLSLSDEEKAFLASEVPHWRTERLKAACEVCSSLFPRARWGLKSDIFAGLLLFELLKGEGEGASRPVAAPREPVVSKVREETSPFAAEAYAVDFDSLPPVPVDRRPGPGERLASSDPVIAEELVRERQVPPMCSSSVADGDGAAPEAFAALWQDELPLCAAMLDVDIEVLDGALSIDYARATPLARAVLDSPRAQLALKRAFGVGEAEKKTIDEAVGTEAAAPKPQGGEARQGQRRSVDSSAMSLPELAAYLGGELLVEKPTESQDLEEMEIL